MENLEGKIEGLEGKMEAIEGKIAIIDGKIENLEGQVSENSSYIRALLHRTEEMSAQFDALLHTTVTKEALAGLATKEDIADLNAQFHVLNDRLFRQETELTKLKAVK